LKKREDVNIVVARAHDFSYLV